MSDTEKLTIAQKIEIARLATDIYKLEYSSGHSTLLTNEKRADDIRNDFLNIYKSVESAIAGGSDSQQ
ncbi:TPA: hypothetical protein M4731_001408 [Salmonella enterica]|nr:hypothetical protein [Salmonella enterica]MCH5735374.1 hypothetical protein [Salmonella enterica]MCH5741808.1 hypothetical protein [Salmonella enterica]MCH5746906.1 hypothetical protein [Salmonella enterica]MCH5757088.1 hypothetical protein [Salmonella enterica]